MSFETAKKAVFWLIGLGLISLSGIFLWQLGIKYILSEIVLILFGFMALPPINSRIQNRLGIDLPDYHVVAIPVTALVLAVLLGYVPSEAYYADFTEQELKNNSTNISEIGYQDLMRNYESHENKIIEYKGQVIDMQTVEDGYIMLIATGYSPSTLYSAGGYSGNIVYTFYTPGEGEIEMSGDRPVEGDILNVWGEYLGPYEYTTSSNSVNTVPSATLWHAERINQTAR